MIRTQKSFTIFAILITLIATSTSPTRVFADDAPPTPGIEAESEPDFEDSEDESGILGMEVLITDEAGEIVPIDSLAGEDALLNGEPVWCPDGQTPNENGDGCTAPYGSIGDLITDIADDTSGKDGTIYIQTPLAETIEVSEMPSAEVVFEIGETDIQFNLGVLVGQEAQSIVDVDSAASEINSDLTSSQELTDTTCSAENGLDLGVCSEVEYQAVAEAVIVGEASPEEENLALEDLTGAVSVLVTEDSSIVPNAVDSSIGTEDINGLLNQQEVLVTDTVLNMENLVIPVSDASVSGDQESIKNDPIWCPDGSAPIPGGYGCTNSFNTLGELVTYLMNNQPTQNGTIWIQEGDDASTGAISINGVIASTWANYALTLNGGWSCISGDMSIVGNTIFDNSIEIVGWQNDVSINDIAIQNTNGIGLLVEIDGDIALENVSSNGNSDFGAVLVNCEYTMYGCGGSETNTVTLTGTNSFNDNGSGSSGADGLLILSDGDIELHNITANNNTMDLNDIGGTGVYVSSTSGDIVLTGTNTFNGNTETGAQFYTGGTGNIYLENLNVSNNLWNGVGVGLDSGDFHIGGFNTFENIRGDAIIVFSEGDIFASNLNTNNTGGIHLETDNGSVFLTGSNYFNNTIYQGHVVFIQASDDVFIEGVTSVNGDNGDGIKVGAGGDVTINCSYSSNNSQYGLEVGFDDWGTGAPLFYPDSLTLNNVTFSNNVSGDYLVNGNSTNVVFNSNYPCSTPPSDDVSLLNVVKDPFILSQDPLPVNVLMLDDAGLGTPLGLNCNQYSEHVLVFANGDAVKFSCPISGNANLIRLSSDPAQLPGLVPSEFSLVSGLTAMLTDTAGGVITFSFTIPADLLISDLTVLYWSGSAWVDLATAAFTDGKLVYDRGTRTADGKYQISTNFVGTFVLVTK